MDGKHYTYISTEKVVEFSNQAVKIYDALKAIYDSFHKGEGDVPSLWQAKAAQVFLEAYQNMDENLKTFVDNNEDFIKQLRGTCADYDHFEGDLTETVNAFGDEPLVEV